MTTETTLRALKDLGFTGVEAEVYVYVIRQLPPYESPGYKGLQKLFGVK